MAQDQKPPVGAERPPMSLEHVRGYFEKWRHLLFEKVPDYGVRRTTQLKAVMRWEAGLLFNQKTESIEFATGLFAIAFGIQLARPFANFSAAYFGGLVSIAPREVWCVVMVFAGVDMILALLTSTKWCRRILAASMTAIWTFIAVVCWLTAPYNVAPAIYSVIAFLCGWTYVRLRPS